MHGWRFNADLFNRPNPLSMGLVLGLSFRKVCRVEEDEFDFLELMVEHKGVLLSASTGLIPCHICP